MNTKMSSAFVDESGHRSFSPKSSDFFVMSAVVLEDADGLRQAAEVAAQLRRELGRHPGDQLHWTNIKPHSQRLRAIQIIGQSPFMTVSSVVVCKRQLTLPQPHWRSDDDTYLNTLAMLLKRLSWIGYERGSIMSYTLAHIVRFKLNTLQEHEAALRATTYDIQWSALDPRGGAIDRPANSDYLQLADLVTSAIAAAFEPDRYGNFEALYLKELASRFYRRSGVELTASGLKVYPSLGGTEAVPACFRWLLDLE